MEERVIKNFIFVLFLLVYSTISSGSIFETLTQAQVYAQLVEEFPLPDDLNWVIPNYTSFYESATPNFLSRLAAKALPFFSARQLLWDSDGFKELLVRVTKERELSGYRDDFIMKLTPAIGSRFIIWGDIQGAFHSLVRALDFLKQFGVINDNLQIIKPDYYFVFNGNVVGRSPFILETLTLVLQLMDKNPNRVIYIRGDDEDRSKWYDSGLRKESEIRLRHLSLEKVPISTFFSHFFHTLPLALYLKSKGDFPEEFVRISYYDRAFEPLNELYFSDFLSARDHGALQSFNLENRFVSILPVTISAIIKSEDRSMVYQYTDGLRLLPFDQGATAWSVLSASTAQYKKLYNFSYDAFAELTVGDSVRNWMIALYSRELNARKEFAMKKFFFESGEKIYETFAVYNDKNYHREYIHDLQRFLKGINAESMALEQQEKVELKGIARVEKGMINVGCTIDLSGVTSAYDREFLRGIRLRIDKQNREGGIQGKLINLIARDDGYDPKKALSLVNKMQQEGIDIFLGSCGSANVIGMIPKMLNNEIVMLFPFAATIVLYNKNIRNIFHLRPSYAHEAFVLVDMALSDLKKKRVALFYQDDAFGNEGIIGVKAALKKHNIHELCLAPYKVQTVMVEEAAIAIEKFQPDTILFVALDRPIAALIERLGSQYFAGKELLAVSVVKTNQDFFEKKALDVTYAQGVLSVEQTNLEIVREYRKEIGRIGKEPKDIVLEGYVEASIFIELIKDIKGPVTKESVLQAIALKKNIFFKDLALSFNEKTRSYSDSVWYKTKKDIWVEKQLSEASLYLINQEYELLKK